MDKTININLGGILFQIDEDAFRMLRDYLQSLNNRFINVQGGHETVEDIEVRIAEIFQSQQGLAGVITRGNVESMISIIGKPEDFDISEGMSDSNYHASSIRRLYRNPDDSIVSGVCGGLGAYFENDPVLFRILFVVVTLFAGIGILLYIVLWIAIPVANSPAKKRELYGDSLYATGTGNRQPAEAYNAGSRTYSPGNTRTSPAGNAINEVFKAIGKTGYIVLRIFLIIIGVTLVLTGFLAILCFVMIFIFRLPEAFTNHGFNLYLGNFPDFLSYIVNPAAAPWIMILTSIAFILPMLALVYWGIKMIFWFKARDGIFSLAGVVLWVMSVAVLVVLLFNEGFSFAESASTTSENILTISPDTLFIMTGNKISDLKFDKEFVLPDDDYNVFMVDSIKRIYIRPELQLTISDDKRAKVEIRRRSFGPTRFEAARKSESLIYNYTINRDSLHLDEYFTIPPKNKWSADFVTINLFLPENTVLYFDRNAGKLFHNRIRRQNAGNEEKYSSLDFDYELGELGNKYWILSDEGLKEVDKVQSKQK